MWFFYIVGLIFILSLVAVFIAIYSTVKQRKTLKNTSSTKTDTRILHTYSDTHESSGNFYTRGAIGSTDYFFLNSQKSGPTVKFYADAPVINVSIDSNKQIDCDYHEVCNFIDKLPDQTEDNFFGLENNQGDIIQFYNDGKSESFEIDVPSAVDKGSYKGDLYSINELKTCVKTFFDGMDMNKYNLKFVKW